MQHCCRQLYVFVEVLLIPISLNRGRNGAPIFPTSKIFNRHVSNVNDRVWFYWAVFWTYKLHTRLNTSLFRSTLQCIFFLPFNLLIGWQLSIWNCCKPFFSLLYNCQLLCSWRLAFSIVVYIYICIYIYIYMRTATNFIYPSCSKAKLFH